ncbi:MAG: hypothetical protein QM572_02865 [Nocardioides sp.]|uniref:DUF7657 domain-containing protein n=1 Tax=Nocardioides sp. TaxID=35761 RepID=UPI0039E42E33
MPSVRQVLGGGRAIVAVPVLVYLILCAGGITTSNIGALYATTPADVPHQIGAAQAVRADEFMTESPISLGWIATGGHGIDNPLSVPPNFFSQLPIGPVSSIVFFDGTLAKLATPLPDSVVFAARWWLPTLLLIIGLPLWFRQISGRSRWGYLASALILLSPSNVWWSGRPVNTLGFMFAAAALMIAAYHALSAGRRWPGAGAILAAAVLIARFPSYYQPFAIILGFPVLVSTCLYILLQRDRAAPRWTAVGMTGALSGALVAGTMAENLDAIRAGLHTVYPGQRISTALQLPFGKVFGAPVLASLESIQSTLAPNTNATEASSSFVILLPIAALLMVPSLLPLRSVALRGILRPEQAVVAVWFTAAVLWLAWCTLGLGPMTGHIPLLNLVPALRAANDAGFLAIVTFCLALPRVPSGARVLAAVAAALTLIATAIAGWSWQHTGMPGLTHEAIAVASVIAASVVGAIVMWPGRPVPLLLALAALLALSGRANPVIAGLGDLRSSPAAARLMAEGAAARSDDTLWASDSPYVDALMFATATPSLSGRQQIGPDQRAWTVLDPDRTHEDVWNRGGTYIRFQWNSDTSITWSNPTIDQIVMATSPCALAEREPRLTHILSTTRLNDPCLTPAFRMRWQGQRFWAYTVDASLREPSGS